MLTSLQFQVLANLPLSFNSKTAKKERRQRNGKTNNDAAATANELETFSVPRSLGVTLDLAPVQTVDVVQLR